MVYIRLLIIYQISVFYLDYRDFRIGYYILYSPPTFGHDIDLWVKYNYSSDAFYYSSTGNSNDFHLVNNKQQLFFWDIKQKNPQLTYLFPSFWENSLGVITTSDNHPKLVWGRYPSNSITINNYKVYRKYGSSAWNIFNTVSSNTFEYTDNSVSLTLPGGQAGVDVQYKVVAVYNNNQETLPTNIVTVNVPGKEIEKTNYNSKIICSEYYSLDQNYPNPFNPVTYIKFSIAENSFVSLKIYDIMGKEIEALVNEEKIPGAYSVGFNGQNLSSGIYFYKL